LKLDLSKFKHITTGEVKFEEVDSFGIVHNIKYLYWIEHARTQYFFDIGLPKNKDFFSQQFPLVTVHTKIDYFNSCEFTDEYKVYTRVSQIRNSSVKFENVITLKAGRPIAHVDGVLVYMDAKTKKVERLPDALRDLVQNYEGDKCEVINE